MNRSFNLIHHGTRKVPNRSQRAALAAQLAFALLVACSVPVRGQSAGDFTWSEHSRLSWDDFKAPPPNGGTSPSAVSKTGFNYQLLCTAGKLDVDAHAFFSPSQSWVLPNKKVPELLNHEQGHFDLSELYARRLKKAIRDANISCDDPAKANAAGQEMARDFQAHWEKAEGEYEQRTQNGTNLRAQEAASKQIASDLDALNAYRQ